MWLIWSDLKADLKRDKLPEDLDWAGSARCTGLTIDVTTAASMHDLVLSARRSCRHHHFNIEGHRRSVALGKRAV
jgi:hypothetical protein